MQGSYLGPSCDDDDVAKRLEAARAKFEILMIGITAQALADGKAIGWIQGRMAFGPRALGRRSFLGDARSPEMQKHLNLKVKCRETFRPFAPSVLREDVSDWFDIDSDSPHMLIVSDVKEDHRRQMTDKENALFGIDKLNVQRSDIPAVTHVDYSARIQTVHAEIHPQYHALITKFKELTGCPIVVNTNFNLRGEPIVCTPKDAFRCFMGTDTELLVIGNVILHKTCRTPPLNKTTTKPSSLINPYPNRKKHSAKWITTGYLCVLLPNVNFTTDNSLKNYKYWLIPLGCLRKAKLYCPTRNTE